MAVAKWDTPRTRSSNIASTVLNSLANAAESAVVTYDNSSNKDLYGAITIKLGSITPSAGGSLTLRVTMSDGTDTADKAAGDRYPIELLSGASAKVVIIPMVRLYPFSMRLSVVNNSGVTLASSGNELYVTGYNEASA
jgi:hypothetical protein